MSSKAEHALVGGAGSEGGGGHEGPTAALVGGAGTGEGGGGHEGPTAALGGEGLTADVGVRADCAEGLTAQLAPSLTPPSDDGAEMRLERASGSTEAPRPMMTARRGRASYYGDPVAWAEVSRAAMPVGDGEACS